MRRNDELADRLKGIKVIDQVVEVRAELLAPQSRRLSKLALHGPRMQRVQDAGKVTASAFLTPQARGRGELASPFPRHPESTLAGVDSDPDRSIFASWAFWLGGCGSVAIWTGIVLALIR
jgi:hypothetical protein